MGSPVALVAGDWRSHPPHSAHLFTAAAVHPAGVRTAPVWMIGRRVPSLTWGYAAAQITPGALDGVPIIGWLVGNNGGWVVLGRAIGFHVAEAAYCFVPAKSTENPEKRMLAMQREQRALLELQRFECIAALERRIFKPASAAFDQVE